MQSILNAQQWLSEPRLVAGVMSGTSLDGIDVAVAEFRCDTTGRHHMRFIGAVSHEFSDEQRRRLRSLIEKPQLISEYNHLNIWLSHETAALIHRVCSSADMNNNTLHAIGMHGQTLWHAPQKQAVLGHEISATLQMGSASTLAQLTSCVTVADFRAADMALGGQGAPLVPIFDHTFLAQPDADVVALNIGGMANISFLSASEPASMVRAFDTGPGNVWIDAAMEMYFDRRYDNKGDVARSGALVPELFSSLCSIEFVHAEPPKSTGRELFSRERLISTLSNSAAGASAADVVHTLTRFTAWSIAENIRRWAAVGSVVVISGGGSLNTFLCQCLGSELPASTIKSCDEMGIPSKWKESLCFGYLAYRTLGGLTSNIPGVTGARSSAILGHISPV